MSNLLVTHKLETYTCTHTESSHKTPEHGTHRIFLLFLGAHYFQSVSFTNNLEKNGNIRGKTTLKLMMRVVKSRIKLEPLELHQSFPTMDISSRKKKKKSPTLCRTNGGNSLSPPRSHVQTNMMY